MFNSLVRVSAIAGGVAATAVGVVPPVTSGSRIAEPPYDDCPPGCYRARSGDCVPRPNTGDSAVTAICQDGSHSHAEHATGACSHHGGVAQWCPCNFSSGQPILEWRQPEEIMKVSTLARIARRYPTRTAQMIKPVPRPLGRPN
jgi:hypothetical protein